MEVAKNKVVQIHYTLQNDEGVVLDSSQGRDPLAYLHGVGQIVVGLEKAMEGKKKGDSFSVTVSPEEGYGLKKPELIQQVPASGFQDSGAPEVGMQVQAQTQNGSIIGTITGVSGDQVTIDFNHQLAGARLHFDIEVVDIRDASAEEISHGHAHGAGGHQH